MCRRKTVCSLGPLEGFESQCISVAIIDPNPLCYQRAGDVASYSFSRGRVFQAQQTHFWPL